MQKLEGCWQALEDEHIVFLAPEEEYYTGQALWNILIEEIQAVNTHHPAGATYYCRIDYALLPVGRRSSHVARRWRRAGTPS